MSMTSTLQNKLKMDSCYCSVAFRIFHPKYAADKICQAIGLEPYRKWTVGQPRTTLKGQRLNGNHRNTFCIFHLTSPKAMEVEEYIELWLKHLTPHRGYLDTLCATGGRLEIYISFFFNKNIGMTLDWKLLSKLAKQRICVEFDLFPKPDVDVSKNLPAWYFKID